MTNYYSSPDEDEELIQILMKIPKWQERFLRLLQRGVVEGEDKYSKEMAEMTLGIVREAYATGKLKGERDALRKQDEVKE